jgi:hypothetical protein
MLNGELTALKMHGHLVRREFGRLGPVRLCALVQSDPDFYGTLRIFLEPLALHVLKYLECTRIQGQASSLFRSRWLVF